MKRYMVYAQADGWISRQYFDDNQQYQAVAHCLSLWNQRRMDSSYIYSFVEIRDQYADYAE